MFYFISLSILQNFQIGLAVHTVSSSVRAVFPFTGLKRPERKFDYLSPSRAEIKNDRSYTSVPTVYFSPVFG